MSTVRHVFADGGVILKNPSPYGGTYAWCWVDEADEVVAQGSGIVLPGERGLGDRITNNQTEYLAVAMAMKGLPDDWSGTVLSDSHCTLLRIFEGARCQNIPLAWVQHMQRIAARMGRVDYVLLAGHPTREQMEEGYRYRAGGKLPVSPFNVWCDLECGRRALEWKDAHPKFEQAP